MLIQSTKKLLDELQVKPEPQAEEEPLFSWHANLLKVKRRKAVVLVNDSNKYVVVLFGLKAGHFKKLSEHILQAICAAFQEECIKEKIIEQFLEQPVKHAKGVIYTKTKTRSMVARMNRSCEMVHHFEDLLDDKTITQPLISNKVSRDFISAGKNKYVHPHEELYKDLETCYKGPIFRAEAVQVKVTLDLDKHHVWRRLVVPAHMTFNQFHKVLQVAFAWQDYHLHEFYIYGYETAAAGDNVLSLNHPAYNREGLKPIVNLVCEEEAFDYDHDVPMKLERGVKLSEYVPAPMKYNYDFGDNWQHYIEVEKTIDDYDKNYPVCLEGEGNAPPEDVGGIGGYEEFLEIMADKTHPEYEEMVAWAREQGYRDFDVEMINRILKIRH